MPGAGTGDTEQAAPGRSVSQMVTGAILSSDDIGDAEVRAWSALADRALEPNPFVRPEFVLSNAKASGEAAALLVVREGSHWLALLPVGVGKRWRRTPLPCLIPWLPELAYSATPLIDRDAPGPAIAGLLDLLAAERWSAALVLHPFDPTGPVGAALTTNLGLRSIAPYVYADFERAAIRRRPENTYLSESLSSAGRKKLRSRKRALGRELGGDLVVVDRSTEPAAWDAFLAMEHAGWKGEQGTALASDSRDAAFFRIMCGGMAAGGRLQLLALEGAGRTVAMQCNLVDGSSLYAFKVAYDEAFARFSPGALLEVEAIELFHDGLGQVELLDSCADPDNALVNRIWPDRRRLQTLVIPTGAPGARLIRPAMGVEVAVRRVIRARRAARAA
ncbi:MAG: FIG01007789: hypothetical protein [uncultured Solirubrobacterales bacterium]|uniref:BioF2-like acetyltransferase domain-containing protein n=1 Tax=uncultured Solirubrobacterales bacterium TaxID=768556 RepID=A0A6J4S534_9ACTN|nr:MAG: FIG01007789: hypothetical protein [uncultured Solirubrobacterales bacterium]